MLLLSGVLFLSLQSDGDNREDIMKVFRLFDDDESGAITIADLSRVARELGESMTPAELKEMIDRADLDGNEQKRRGRWKEIRSLL